MKVVPFRVREGTYTFPGFTYTVKFVSMKELKSKGTCSHCGKEDFDEEEQYGDWTYDTGGGQAMIRIWKGASMPRKRYVFYHEFEHLLVDLRHVIKETGAERFIR